ncbi:hypothetical protein WISP_43878 [Willisornis vidua]|uniref:Uncharacterized protein n=1 Tax=Willisornis vidua TaxID=1566151 RepID=A0ABQ9DLR2_9PASS|nr:hypothetical protein WISP_43878 [Willisornis vidua]
MLCLMPPRTWLALLAATTLLTHIQLAINQDLQGPFHGTAFQYLIPQSLHVGIDSGSVDLLVSEVIDEETDLNSLKYILEKKSSLECTLKEEGAT